DIGNAPGQEFWREPHVADLWHARVALRTTIFQNENVVFVYIEIRILDAVVVVFDRIEHYRFSSMGEKFLCCRRRFNHSPRRSKVTLENSTPRLLREGIL